MTSDAPRHSVAMMTRTTPSCQLVPETKNMSEPATAPAQANPANRRVGCSLRSAMAPTKMRKIAEMIVEMVTVYGYTDPGENGTPTTERLVRQSWPLLIPGQAA